MASPDDAVAGGSSARRVIWVVAAVGIGVGLAAGSGSIVDGTGTTAAVDEALLPALAGALVGLVVGGFAAWLLRSRVSPGVGRKDVAIVAVVVAGCLGALIGAGSVGEPPPIAPAVEDVGPDDIDAGVTATATGGRVAAPERSQNNLDEISDVEGTIILLAGLALLLWALWFFSKQFDDVPIDPGMLLLEPRDLLDDEDDPGPDSVADALERSLGALRASNDPRDSILAAYATLLDELELVGLGRHRWEGPMEHVGRCLSATELPDGPIEALVELFGEARFGTRPMTPADRDAAQQALVESVAMLRDRVAIVAGPRR